MNSQKDIESETFICTLSDVAVFASFDEINQKFCYVMKHPHKLKINKSLLTNEKINTNIFFYKISNVKVSSDFTVIEHFTDYIPLRIFLSNYKINESTYFILVSLLSISTHLEIIDKFLEYIDVDMLWIDKDHNIKLCWFSFLIKYEKYFDNTVYKANIKSISDIVNLFTYNARRIEKRKNLDVDYSDTQVEICKEIDNYFSNNKNENKNEKCGIYKGIVKYSDLSERGDIKVSKKKKFCIPGIRTQYKIKLRQKSVNRAIKLLILKLLFDDASINEKMLDLYILKLKTMRDDRVNGEVDYFEDTLDFLENDRIKINKVIEKKENKFVAEYIERIKSTVELNSTAKITVSKGEGDLGKVSKGEGNLGKISNGEGDLGKVSKGEGNPGKVSKGEEDLEKNNHQETENVFEEKGFNMAIYDTKTYKKGRFFVCQAIPNFFTNDKNKGIDLKKVFQIIEIQNSQIQMMYQTLKENSKMDQLIDAQLEELSLQVNVIMTNLDKKK